MMISTNVKRAMLDSLVSSNGKYFFELTDQYPNLQWNEITLNKSGDSVAHVACQFGAVSVLKYLHETGNKRLFEHRNFDGKTALHLAVQFSELECVKYLLSCDVEINALKRADWTPLMLACTKSNIDIIQELVSHGADLCCKNKDGWTAFHIATREGDNQVIEFLLSINPFLWQTRSNNARTPLHTSALHGHLEIVKKILINEDCDIDNQDACGTTALMDAVSGNHLSIVDHFIKNNADVNKTDALGRNPLHLAAQSGSLECIQFLVSSYDISINKQTTAGLTPLHFAAKEENLDCVKLLLSLGADLSITDFKGRPASKYTSKEEIVNILC